MLLLRTSTFATLIVFALAAVNDYSRKCWSSGNGNSARWWDEGTRIDRGAYWYRCYNGKLEPMGCKTSSGREMALGGTEVEGDIELTCVKGTDGFLEKKITACVQNGRRYRDAESWDDYQNGEWYTCVRSSNGYYLVTTKKGCIHQGARVGYDEKRRDGSCIKQCHRQYAGSAKMSVVGCVQDNVDRMIGDKFPIEQNRFTGYCALDDAKTGCEVVCIGCVHNNQRLTDGDQYFLGDSIFQCTVRPTSHDHRVTGCVQRDSAGNIFERVINCRWYNDEGGHRYEVTCVEDMGNNKSYIKPEACIFMKNGKETLYLKPDTYTVYWNGQEDMGVLCKRESDTRLRIEEFHPDHTATRALGLQYEMPRGR